VKLSHRVMWRDESEILKSKAFEDFRLVMITAIFTHHHGGEYRLYILRGDGRRILWNSYSILHVKFVQKTLLEIVIWQKRIRIVACEL
jgi:hypothetical protein